MFQRNQLVRVFNPAYPDGKLRYFKRYDETVDPVSHYVTFADGRTEETDDGAEEYWDDMVSAKEIKEW